MSKDNLVYLKHILEAIQRIGDYTKGVEYSGFMSSNLIQAGVVREIEIIGEAAKRLSPGFREKHRDIPWKKMSGMRDKLIHDYLGVDLDAVWDTIKKDIPVLEEKIRRIVEGEKPAGGMEGRASGRREDGR
mgnify:CR=1 FL=1